MTALVAVTGAAGFVGGRLVQRLRAEGQEVRPLVRRPTSWLPGARALDLAVASPAEVRGALEGCTAVVHLAGPNEVATARQPEQALAVTAATARRVATAAREVGCSRLVQLSTVHVYGAALELGGRVDEATLPQPRHPYAIGRLVGEHLAAAEGPPAVVNLRLTNTVGAPAHPSVDRWTLVANELCAAAARGEPLVLRSSGLQWRDFCDLGEACGAIGAAAIGAVPAGTYNLGSGRSRTVRDLAELIADLAAPLVGRRPQVDAPAHEGPSPSPVVVGVEALAAHLPPMVVPLEQSLIELIEACLTTAGASAMGGEG